MSAYTLPDGAPLDQNGNFKPAFAQWLTRTHNSAVTLQQSGATGDRPDTLLWIGRFYFDTTLTKPIWIKSVNASGVATWCDATGATV
jgi:hypothetical protein